jgi:hypothetical protein
MDRVCAASSWVHGPPLNNSHWFFDLRFRFNEAEGISLDLITIIGDAMDGSQWLEQQRRRLMVTCGGADRGSPEPVSELSEVPFYTQFGPTGRHIERNSPRLVVCGCGDREVARNGGLTLMSFDSGERLLLSSSGFKKQFKRSLMTSSCSLLTWMASRDGGSRKPQLA